MVSGQGPGRSPGPMPLVHQRSLSVYSSESFLASFHIYLLITEGEVGSEQLLAAPGVTAGEPGDLSAGDGVGETGQIQGQCLSAVSTSFTPSASLRDDADTESYKISMIWIRERKKLKPEEFPPAASHSAEFKSSLGPHHGLNESPRSIHFHFPSLTAQATSKTVLLKP